jgi:Nucleotidyl transferase AbiEii toxin, Type IV TA system
VDGVTPSISADQLRALAVVAPALPPSTYLAGGVAVALRCGHRTSVDLDLFTPNDPVATSLPALERLDGVVITSRHPRTLYLEVGGIPTSIISYAYPHLEPPIRIEEVPVPVASAPDLVTMKLAAIVDRGAMRDFWDLHELLHHEAIALPDALVLHLRRFPRHDLGHVVRALVYFADAEASPFPRGLDPDRWDAIRTDFQRWVRAYASRT